MSPREHARLLGLLYWIYIGINVLLTIVSFGLVIGVFGTIQSELSNIPRRPGEPGPEAFFGFMMIALIIGLVITVAILAVQAAAAYGLRAEKSWAKVWAIVASCLAILSFPLGTALGIYGLWFIFGEKGKAYFDNPQGFYNTPPRPPQSWQ